MKAIIITLMLVLFCTFTAIPQDLALTRDDLRIEQGVDGGFHLWIRKKPEIESVLLTESTADPEKKATVYSYRNPEYHAVNGDESRMLDGKLLDKTKGLYSLIDSTVENDEDFGEAYHIYIPYIVIWGYPWSLRSGETYIHDGTYINIRSFEKSFGDYTGRFKDNPFVLRVTQKPLEGPPEGNFMPDTVDNYKDIADKGNGEAIFSSGEDDINDKIAAIIDKTEGKSLDLVLALDTTQSMENDLPYLRQNLIPILQRHTSGFEEFRIGIVYYRDYFEEYLTKTVPFQSFNTGYGVVQNALNTIRVMGGRDIPEAVYEALYVGVIDFSWTSEARKIVLIGDAPPHPRPRGRVTRDMVYDEAGKRNIEINTIILPQ